MNEQIKIAVEWWAEQLKDPTFKTLSDQERRAEPLQPAAFSEVMAERSAKRHPVTAGQLETFKTALAGSIEADDLRGWVLSVGYSPGRVLAEAATTAGIDNSRFPIKTIMWLHNGGVRVSLGYGTSPEQLLSETT